MKVAVVGWHGFGNAGDDLLRASLEHVLRGHRLMVTSWYPGFDALRDAELIVIGGGSIWPHHKVFEDSARLARRPVMVLGVSAKDDDPAKLAMSRPLMDTAKLFTVRDSDTLAVMGGHPNVRLAPDLFWWMPWNPGAEGEAEGDAVALNLRGWLPADWSPEAIAGTLKDMGYRAHAAPLFFGHPRTDKASGETDGELLSRLGLADVPQSFTALPFLRGRFTVAMRFHALLVALRLRRPVIGFDYHPKIRALFEDCGFPELCVPLDDPRALRGAVERLEGDFAGYARKVEAVAARAEADGAAMLVEARRVVEGIPMQAPRRRFLGFR